MAGTATGSERLPLLDGLRGVAAIGVVLYHVHNFYGLTGWFEANYLFVDFFFLLSGFVLARSAEPRMVGFRSSMAFLHARLRRLWPTMALGVALGAAAHFYLHGGAGLAPYALLAMLFVPLFWHEEELFPLNAPQWSLLFELLANLLHALVLRRLTSRTLLIVTVISALALAAAIQSYGSATFGPDGRNWWLAVPRVMFAYCLGILLARTWRSKASVEGTPWWLALVLPPIVVTIMPFLPISPMLRDIFVTIVALPALFVLPLSAATAPEWANQWMSRLGALSFPLYAIHLPIVGICHAMSDTGLSAVAGPTVSLVASGLFAWAAAGARSRTRRSGSGRALAAT